jgi:hypothetical protein
LDEGRTECPTAGLAPRWTEFSDAGRSPLTPGSAREASSRIAPRVASRALRERRVAPCRRSHEAHVNSRAHHHWARAFWANPEGGLRPASLVIVSSSDRQADVNDTWLAVRRNRPRAACSSAIRPIAPSAADDSTLLDDAIPRRTLVTPRTILDFLRGMSPGPHARLLTERRVRPLLPLDPAIQMREARTLLPGFVPARTTRRTG